MRAADIRASCTRLPVVATVQPPTLHPAGQEGCASHRTPTGEPTGSALGSWEESLGGKLCFCVTKQYLSVNKKAIIMTTAHQLLKHVPLNVH